MVGAIGKTVKGGVGEDGVGEESHPLRNVAVAGNDEAGTAVAFDDEGVEVFRLLLVEPLETEVIDDKQVGGEVAAEDDLEAVVGAGLSQLPEQEVGATEEDGVSCTGAAAPSAWARKVLPTPTGPIKRTCSFFCRNWSETPLPRPPHSSLPGALECPGASHQLDDLVNYQDHGPMYGRQSSFSTRPNS